LRPSSSIASWAAVSTLLSSASTCRRKPARSNTSRATRKARVTSDTDAPVSSPNRNTKVVPPKLTMSFTTRVVMISRPSGCASI
jgi:hypothetical protein